MSFNAPKSMAEQIAHHLTQQIQELKVVAKPTKENQSER
jgi:hypothetical protein